MGIYVWKSFFAPHVSPQRRCRTVLLRTSDADDDDSVSVRVGSGWGVCWEANCDHLQANLGVRLEYSTAPQRLPPLHSLLKDDGSTL